MANDLNSFVNKPRQGFCKRWWLALQRTSLYRPSNPSNPSKRCYPHLDHLPPDQHHPSRLNNRLLCSHFSLHSGTLFQLLRSCNAHSHPKTRKVYKEKQLNCRNFINFLLTIGTFPHTDLGRSEVVSGSGWRSTSLRLLGAGIAFSVCVCQPSCQ